MEVPGERELRPLLPDDPSRISVAAMFEMAFVDVVRYKHGFIPGRPFGSGFADLANRKQPDGKQMTWA